MKERTNKIKNWWEEHKDGIKRGVENYGFYLVGLGVGYFIGKKVTETRFCFGISENMRKGVMKLVNPATGDEIGLKEAAELVKTID